MYFLFQSGGPITAGLISGRGAYIGGGGGRGVLSGEFWRGGLIIACTFFPGRWAYKFGAYEWQFMVIYVVV